jgi:hypothetical protein
LTAGCGQHPVSSSLKHEFANGKSLFVVVDTQNSFLWAHGSFKFSFQRSCESRAHISCARPPAWWRTELAASRMAASVSARRPACGHHAYGDSRFSYSSSAHPSASDLNSIVRVKADSRVTSTATLAQSTKMKAMCKRRRSSEVVLAFCRRFHRYSVSCCQCCLSAWLTLLKACESFKEKTLFCYRISAAKNKKMLDLVSTVFPFLISVRELHNTMIDSGTLATCEFDTSLRQFYA